MSFIALFSLIPIAQTIIFALGSEGKIEKIKSDILKVPLSKQDFETVMSNFNHDLVEKIIKENNEELCYKDLKELDDLLLKQNEVLIKIKKEKIEDIWKEIDREAIFEKFKGKSEEEIMNELNSMGLSVKNKDKIIAKRDFYRSLKEKYKEEYIS